ncbi:MAG: carbohydrate-binding domain-containing protein [Lachnospiraceae bacterium]|nr:carbohydrate-binding domain-containing protein [Lachnospiraceae bacterium]
MKKTISIIIALTAFVTVSAALTGCGAITANAVSKETVSGILTTKNSETAEIVNDEQSAAGNSGSNSNKNGTASAESKSSNTGASNDTSDIFSKRDLNQEPDLTDAETVEVQDDQVITITEAGIFVISGKASNCTIKVEADKDDKVQLVLDGVSISNDDFPAIYVVSADKCFITTTDSENSLTVTGKFTSDGDTKTDAVIFSKDDLVLNGTGTLNITSAYGNGISGKDDIKVTGGTYNIKSAEDAIEANDSIAVCDGSFTINTSKDGLHAENDDDDTTGWIFISGGTFSINATSDAIQATSYVQIDGGVFEITAREGIEATFVQVNDGQISITASDDGINASNKSSAYSVPVVEINGGSTTIVMGQGDTDAIDANGNIYVNGGTIDITATVSSFDYDGTAEFNGGTIIINGSEVDSIPQSMMGGFGGPGNVGGFGGRGGFGGNENNGGTGDLGNSNGNGGPGNSGNGENSGRGRRSW